MSENIDPELQVALLKQVLTNVRQKVATIHRQMDSEEDITYTVAGLTKLLGLHPEVKIIDPEDGSAIKLWVDKSGNQY